MGVAGNSSSQYSGCVCCRGQLQLPVQWLCLLSRLTPAPSTVAVSAVAVNSSSQYSGCVCCRGQLQLSVQWLCLLSRSTPAPSTVAVSAVAGNSSSQYSSSETAAEDTAQT